MRPMIFQQIVNEDAGCISYLIACSQAGQALVVDPASGRLFVLKASGITRRAIHSVMIRPGCSKTSVVRRFV